MATTKKPHRNVVQLKNPAKKKEGPSKKKGRPRKYDKSDLSVSWSYRPTPDQLAWMTAHGERFGGPTGALRAGLNLLMQLTSGTRPEAAAIAARLRVLAQEVELLDPPVK